MRSIGYVRVSTERQADRGISLEAQEAKIRAMATVQGADLIDVIVDGGESAKSLNRPGLQRLLEMVNKGEVQAIIIAKLDRLTRSVKDLCGLLELLEKRKVALVSVAESLDTSTAAGRLVITIMGAVSQWEREAIGERTRDVLRHKRAPGLSRRQHPIRVPARGRRTHARARRDRTASHGRHSEASGSGAQPARSGDCCEPTGAPHTPGNGLAAGICRSSPPNVLPTSLIWST